MWALPSNGCFPGSAVHALSKYNIVVLIDIWSGWSPTIHNHLCSWYLFFVHSLLLINTPLVTALHSFTSAPLLCIALNSIWLLYPALHWKLKNLAAHCLVPFIGTWSTGKTLEHSQVTLLFLVSQSVYQTFQMIEVMCVQARQCSPIWLLRGEESLDVSVGWESWAGQAAFTVSLDSVPMTVLTLRTVEYEDMNWRQLFQDTNLWFFFMVTVWTFGFHNDTKFLNW
jgi:hypothetical protein